MDWYSSWAASVGSDRLPESAGKVADDGRKVALVVGITGIVGVCLADMLPRSDAPGGAWKVYGVARRREPDLFKDCPIHYVQCDVLNDADVKQKISPLTDVTHLFWVTWASRSTEEENCAVNGEMLQNVVNVLLAKAPKFKHICLQTGTKHYMGSFFSSGKVDMHEPPYREDMARLPVPCFYYTLEDIVFDAAKKKEGLTWSVHRPGIILGFSPWGLMNLIGTLAVCAAICKKKGLPFLYPGNKITWESLGDASDAEMIAEQEIWASVDPKAKNQAFNTANGDVVSFKQIWTQVAKKYELQVPPYDDQHKSLEEMMKGTEPVWDKIVAEHGLHPTKLSEVGHWWFADFMLNTPFAPVSSMNKSKKLGFLGFRDTEAAVLFWIDKMRESKIVP